MLHSIRHYLSAYFFCGLFVLFLFLPLTKGFAQQLAVSSPARALYRGDYEHAKQLAWSQFQKKPTDLPVHIILARAELAMGNYGEALAELKRVFMSDPHNIAAFQKLDQLGCTASEQRSVETGE